MTTTSFQFQHLVARAQARIPVSAKEGLGARYDLVDMDALRWLAETMAEGHGRGKDNGAGMPEWKTMDVGYHLLRAEAHIQKALRGDTTEDHLRHAFCRLHFALAKHHEQVAGEQVIGRLIQEGAEEGCP